jgi:hypothetical protein
VPLVGSVFRRNPSGHRLPALVAALVTTHIGSRLCAFLEAASAQR